jgi:GNAT superfamily N-acetyltransferase
VTTTHLQMRSPDLLRPTADRVHGAEVSLVEIPSPALNHFFFVNVGRPWRWYSRLRWSRPDWERWVEREDVITGVGCLGGAPFGYFELMLQNGGADVELVFFGVLPEMQGRGLGGPLLVDAVRTAWDLGPSRVWLHTCTEDHPHALANYLARGFEVFLVETKDEDIPDDDDPLWCTPAYFASLARLR